METKKLFQEDKVQLGNIEIPVHLACANDELRPVMNCVLVTKEHIVASDAHILVRHITSEIFTENFIKGFPSDRFLIHGSAWQKLTEQQVLRFGWSATDPDCILVEYNSKREYVTSIRVKHEDVGYISKYPDYSKVIPDPKKIAAFDQIPFRPDFLDRLFKAMATPYNRQNGCSLFPTNVNEQNNVLHTAIIVRANSMDARNVLGLIMPVMYNGDDNIKKW